MFKLQTLSSYDTYSNFLRNYCGFRLFPLRSPLLRECVSQTSKMCETLVSFPPGTMMFRFPGFTPVPYGSGNFVYREIGFPHSEILGSKVATHLPETYRSYAASFIASISQGIRHLLVKVTAFLRIDTDFKYLFIILLFFQRTV